MIRWARLLPLAALLLPLLAPSARAGDPPPSRPALVAAAGRSGLRAEVLKEALRAQAQALRSGATVARILTVIDYSLPSRERRLWVLDLARDSVLAHELVAHGRNTGDDVARRFSNRPGSLQSSLGTFVTGRTYRGRHGLALRLRGLDRGVNDRAEARAIVVHGADYVSLDLVRRLGRLGRSQGCPALEPAVAPRVIGLIRDGSVLFAYHPTLDTGSGAPRS
ncbi:MAG TPA: murein L,D-transpeptidase catalytic domain family protein [Gemmatimonadales bacterium]|nr:murein L,D-transpeptidase catalytic domain family protein [Gemmatimonadales bacterium]